MTILVKKLCCGIIPLLMFCLVMGWNAEAFAQSEQQRLEQLNSQMIKDDAAQKHVALEKNARRYIEIATRRQHAGLLAVGHFWLGRALMGQEKYADSALALETAYQYGKKTEPDFAMGILDDLALVYANQARYQEAEKTYLLVLKSHEEKRGANDPSLVKPCLNLANLYKTMIRYEDAEKQYLIAQEILNKQPELNKSMMINVVYGLAVIRYNQFRYEDAESLYKQSAELAIDAFGPKSAQIGIIQGGLGLLYRMEGRYGEAEQATLMAVKVASATYGPNHSATADNQAILADFYRIQGRFSEAETLAKQVLETRKKIFRTGHPMIATAMLNLAYILEDQDRKQESLSLFSQALEIYRKSYGPSDARVQRVMNTIGFVLGVLGQYEEAEKMIRQALSAVKPESYDAASMNANLANVLIFQNRLKEAEPLLLLALSIKENDADLRRDDPRLTSTLAGLGALYLRMKDYDKAGQYLERQISILEREPQTKGELAVALTQRAKVNRVQNRLVDAQNDLQRAMDLVDEQRTQFSGGDVDRSQAFIQLTQVFERMVHLQTELGDTEEAYLAMERGRARALLDQLTVQGVDLLEGIPANKVEKIRKRLAEIAQFQAQVEQQTEALKEQGLDPKQEREARRALAKKFQAAQQMYVSVQAEIRNLSPAYRLAVGKDQQPTDFTELQKEVTHRKALLLRYLVGIDGAYLLVVPAGGEARLEKLVVRNEVAEKLGMKPGKVTTQTLNAAFANHTNDGVLQLLRRSRNRQANDQLTPKLAALWELLIPAAERKRLTSGTYEQLIIVPDGALTMLPFAALVVEEEDRPVYALDVCPAMVYAPSATILTNLSERKEVAQKGDRKPILTVGDPSYHVTGSAEANQATPQARYSRLGGELQSLPFSGLEAQWVSEIFDREGIKVGKLTKTDATERNVVINIPGRRIVHLACHGLMDQSYGNLFGALAFSPLRTGSTADDGFLTLAEIYNLDMRGCELTILSACDTNIGPTQIGEGVWALSRGFLVAGSKRVVASNWVVDDKAAASLISYYCGFLAQAETKGEQPDYADCLRKARRWVREQEQWESPYYWATFVHVGPN